MTGSNSAHERHDGEKQKGYKSRSEAERMVPAILHHALLPILGSVPCVNLFILSACRSISKALIIREIVSLSLA
jgi:hypothetical protein